MRDRGGNFSDPDGRRVRVRTLVIEDERLRRFSYISRSGEAKKAMKELSFLSANVISGYGEILYDIRRSGASQRTARKQMIVSSRGRRQLREWSKVAWVNIRKKGSGE